MLMMLKLAWRNIFRNRRRTLLAGLAVGVCLGSLIFVDGLYIGMFQSMVRTSTDSFMGQGQIHAEGFRGTYEVENTIRDSDTVMSGLASEEIVTQYSPRTLSYGMLTSAANVGAAVLYGIDPVREKDLSRLDEAVREGGFIEPDGLGQILIGSKAAEVLEVGIGDRLVVTVARAETGELSQEMFRVAGIFHFNVREADSAMAYIHIRKAQEMLGLGRQVHEIALRFKDIEMAGDRSMGFWSRYSAGGNEALGWRDLISQLDSIMEMVNVSTVITLTLIFGIVALTIMNTLFMSLYERMFEFGVLRAVGTRPVSLASIILLESFSLSVISILIGSLLGALVSWYFSVYGIDYIGIEFAGVTFVELLHPVLKIKQFTLFPVLIIIFSLVAAIYPAIYAARLRPAEAMRKSL
jgi:ABC-type lipoprotein release transport system permease subunit